MGPQRIVCLTEESVEFLYSIGEGHRIVGVSAYVERPTEATSLPKVSAFINGHVKKICELKPDLVLGFSDIQKDLARDLIGAGLNVFIANQRSIYEIIDYMRLLGAMVGANDRTTLFLEEISSKIERAEVFAKTLKQRPRIYIEEWDDPKIAAIKWFNEIVELCGGDSITGELAENSMAKDRFPQDEDIIKGNPEIILASWCGKKVDINSIKSRKGWADISAVKHGHIYELDPAIFLQPGPAPFVDGIDQIIGIINNWSS